METAAPPAPAVGHRCLSRFGGEDAHGEKGWDCGCVGKVGQSWGVGGETRVNMNWEDFQSRQRAWKRTGFEFCMFF